MIIGPGGRRIPPATPTQPLRIGRIVHIADGRTCIPFLVNFVHDDGTQVSGLAATNSGWVPVQGIAHNLHPTLILGRPANSWHWPQECPSER